MSMVSNYRRRKSRNPLAQKQRAALAAALVSKIVSGLRRLHIFGLPPLGALYHIELHLLAFLQTAEAARLNRREVYEHILAALATDKPIALGIVKPLYCSCFHGVARFLFCQICAVSIAELLQAGHAAVAGVAEKLQRTAKFKRSRNCTSEVTGIAKIFHCMKYKYLCINNLQRFKCQTFTRDSRPRLGRIRWSIAIHIQFTAQPKSVMQIQQTDLRDWNPFPLRRIMNPCSSVIS